MSTFIETEREQYLPSAVSSQGLEIIQSEDGPSAIIDGVEYPILTEVFNLSIVQPGHAQRDQKFIGHAGEVYIEELDEFYKERTLLPIRIIRFGQQLFDGNYDTKKENKPLCYSIDGMKPSSKVFNPKCGLGGECAVIEEGRNGPYRKLTCPKAVWENGAKPECRGYVVVAFLDVTDPETPIPLRMTLKGTGMSALTTLNRAYERIKNVARLKKQNLSDYSVKLTVDNKGTYCVPVFTPTYDASKPSKYMYMRAYYRDVIERYDRTAATIEDSESGKIEAVGNAIDVGDAQAAAENAVNFEF